MIDFKTVHMAVVPAHRNLDHLMQISERVIIGQPPRRQIGGRMNFSEILS